MASHIAAAKVGRTLTIFQIFQTLMDYLNPLEEQMKFFVYL